MRELTLWLSLKLTGLAALAHAAWHLAGLPCPF